MDLSKKFAGFESAERPTLGLALIFDISGFTNFFNKPDIHYYMTSYINQVIDCVEVIIWGGKSFWLENPPPGDELPLPHKPILRKFLGDGMLYVWEDDESRYMSSPDFKVMLINRLWNLQMRFQEVNKRLNEIIPIIDLPQTIKVGIAQGSIFKLTEADGTIDCIGPCINLASRLVKYCPELNFIASARLNLHKTHLEDNGYTKTIATELRSFENEIVIVDKSDFSGVNEVDRLRLFKYLPV
jgi:class 3 adenylate cyclase